MVFWFTGLSGAGKTTLANALIEYFKQNGKCVLLLDGDEVRRNLCSDLGFSMEDRAENIRRIASCARLAEDSGLIVCVACITPLATHRAIARNMVRDFHEIYVNSDIDTCRQRDPKGNYKKCLPNYTGISSKYETPLHADLIINTCDESVDESVAKLIDYAVTKSGVSRRDAQ